MKETLHLNPRLDGQLWFYSGAAPAARRRMHRHDELEFNLVARGTASYLMLERRYALRQNSLVWMFPNQEHLLLDESRDFKMWVAVFRASLLQRACEDAAYRTLQDKNPAGDFYRRLPPVVAARLGTLLEQVKSAEHDPPRHNAGLTYALLQSWSAFAAADVVVGLDVHPAVERAAKLLRDETEPTRLSELAADAGLSSSRLSRVFKAQTGLSLVHFRQRQQLDRFFRLYGSGQRTTMLAAAMAAGFGSYAQFHRVFKRLVGKSPAEHRRARSLGE
jgi:AraC-like DNA-binding protein